MNGPQATAAARDAIDTIFVAASTSAQKPSDVKPEAALQPMSVPQPVAALLPPLKFKKTDLLCPITARIPQAQGSHGVSIDGSSGTQPPRTASMARVTGIQPFRMSMPKTKAAAVLPALRRTLVAPVEPLPTLRRSMPTSAFTTQYPVGMEP